MNPFILLCRSVLTLVVRPQMQSQTCRQQRIFHTLCPCCGLSRGVFLPLCFLSCLLRRFYSLLVNSCRDVTSVRGKQRLSLGLCRGRGHKTPASGNVNEELGPRRQGVRKVRNVHWCYWLRMDPCSVPDRGMFQVCLFVRNFVSLMTGCSTLCKSAQRASAAYAGFSHGATTSA